MITDADLGIQAAVRGKPWNLVSLTNFFETLYPCLYLFEHLKQSGLQFLQKENKNVLDLPVSAAVIFLLRFYGKSQ